MDLYNILNIISQIVIGVLIINRYFKYKASIDKIIDKISLYIIELLIFVYIYNMTFGTGIEIFSVTENKSDAWIKLLDHWENWQTLNGAMITLLGAIFFYQGTQKTYKNRTKQEQDRLQRELIANRAFIPHALASIIPYLESASKYYEQLYKLIREDEVGQIKTIDHSELNQYIPYPLNSYQSAFKDFFFILLKNILIGL